MALEDEIKVLMEADSVLPLVLTGGIHTRGEVGRDGLTQDATPDIFDIDGDLLPTALIVSRDTIADGQVNDYDTADISVFQNAEIHIYQERDYDIIDLVLDRLRQILHGEEVDNGFELEFILELPRLRDEAALAGASQARQDWSASTVL